MYLGLGFVCSFAACAAWGVRVLSEAFAVLAGIWFLGAILAIPGLMRAKSAGRDYDLASLREIHEREELKRLELEETPVFDSVHCLSCGEVYNIRMPLCPKCGAAPGHR